jgi:hypothetical protein
MLPILNSLHENWPKFDCALPKNEVTAHYDTEDFKGKYVYEILQ